MGNGERERSEKPNDSNPGEQIECNIAKNPGKYNLAGDGFGDSDPYGIGLPFDSDGVAFVNGFLQRIEGDGTWAKLWKIAIGDRTDVSDVPNPPAIG